MILYMAQSFLQGKLIELVEVEKVHLQELSLSSLDCEGSDNTYSENIKYRGTEHVKSEITIYKLLYKFCTYFKSSLTFIQIYFNIL